MVSEERGVRYCHFFFHEERLHTHSFTKRLQCPTSQSSAFWDQRRLGLLWRGIGGKRFADALIHVTARHLHFAAQLFDGLRSRARHVVDLLQDGGQGGFVSDFALDRAALLDGHAPRRVAHQKGGHVHLHARVLDPVLVPQVNFEPNVLPHVVVLLDVVAVPHVELLEVFRLDVANEATAFQVLFHEVAVGPHLGKSVNDNTAHDGGNHQVDEEVVQKPEHRAFRA